MLKSLLNCMLGTHMPDDKKTFLIKTKYLEPITATILVEGLTAHMRRTGNNLISNKVAHPAGHDVKFEELATNILKLAEDIDTFLRKKGDKAGEKPFRRPLSPPAP